MRCDHICTKCGEHENRYLADEIATRCNERKLCVRCDGWFYELQQEDFRKHGRPTTDEQFCAHLARFFVRFGASHAQRQADRCLARQAVLGAPPA